jgi:hypothetical protein
MPPDDEPGGAAGLAAALCAVRWPGAALAVLGETLHAAVPGGADVR